MHRSTILFLFSLASPIGSVAGGFDRTSQASLVGLPECLSESFGDALPTWDEICAFVLPFPGKTLLGCIEDNRHIVDLWFEHNCFDVIPELHENIARQTTLSTIPLPSATSSPESEVTTTFATATWPTPPTTPDKITLPTTVWVVTTTISSTLLEPSTAIWPTPSATPEKITLPTTAWPVTTSTLIPPTPTPTTTWPTPLTTPTTPLTTLTKITLPTTTLTVETSASPLYSSNKITLSGTSVTVGTWPESSAEITVVTISGKMVTTVPQIVSLATISGKVVSTASITAPTKPSVTSTPATTLATTTSPTPELTVNTSLPSATQPNPSTPVSGVGGTANTHTSSRSSGSLLYSPSWFYYFLAIHTVRWSFCYFTS